MPLYAIQTDLTSGRVLSGARAFVAAARTTKKQSRLINADPEQSHLDPLLAAASQNRFLTTVVPFLRKKVFAEPKKGRGKPAKKKANR